MAGTKITRENASPAAAALLPVFEWLVDNAPYYWASIRLCASFDAPLFAQKNLFEDALKGAPAEIVSCFTEGWPLYVAEEEEDGQ